MGGVKTSEFISVEGRGETKGKRRSRRTPEKSIGRCTRDAKNGD